MPALSLSLDLTPTVTAEQLSLACLACSLTSCEWKTIMPDQRTIGLHTKCKIRLEQRRPPSGTMQAVKP